MENFPPLSSGHGMPMIGLGCGGMQTRDHAELEKVLNLALEIGYRHFDTAYMYGNESVLGKVFKQWIDSGKITRKELFIISKLPPVGNHPSKVRHFLQLSLDALGFDYVDLYLIHTPVGFIYVDDKQMLPRLSDGSVALDMTTNLEALWGAMEERVDEGLCQSIGLSNFTPSQLKRILGVSRIPPANIQIELHAYCQQEELQSICKEAGISITAYAPLGSQGRGEMPKRWVPTATYTAPPLLEDPIVKNLALKHQKTPAQILLRHLIQLRISPIPASTNPNRLKENAQVFDFELTQEDMMELRSLDRGDAGICFTASFYSDLMAHPEFPYK